GEFCKLGFGDPLPVSAIESRNRDELLDALCAILPAAPEAPEKPVMKLAIVGRRNVGKSTLINTLADEPRMIVSEVPGTTRDSVDVLFEKGGQTFMAIDTAGLVKRGKTKTSIEFYSYCRAQRSIRRADVVLLLLDAPGDVSEVDKKVADYIRAQFKPCILVVNKWDLAKSVDTEKYDAYVRDRLRALPFAPLSFISAQERKNVWATIQLAQDLFGQYTTRVSTAEINRVLQRAQATLQTGRRNVKRGHILYGTQVAVAPPSFVLFVNDPALFDDKYMRYLEGRFRAELPFAEVPVKFTLRGRMRLQRGAVRPGVRVPTIRHGGQGGNELRTEAN
ncbi:MAG: ribosome biogenesis GTPase Der, partial [Planctomycetes bacterium]|nr:ribosome biogenesis GTPase Der [Planctomycetota bacterium]